MAYDFIPGVPSAGHIARGFWHSGPITNCQKCKEHEKLRSNLRSRQVLRVPPPRNS